MLRGLMLEGGELNFRDNALDEGLTKNPLLVGLGEMREAVLIDDGGGLEKDFDSVA